MKIREISFTELIKNIKDITNTEKFKYSLVKLYYVPSFFIYGITVILLLKISQFVLGWHF